MRSGFTRAAFAAALTACASLASAASLTHSYNLNGSYADSLGGPSLVAEGGTLGADLYTFGANQGLSLSNALTGTEGDYSIELYFEFDSTGGYRKIIDFKNTSSDTGLYNNSTTMHFYNVAAGPAGAFANNAFAHVVLTRDGVSGTTTGYVNGVQQLSFTDGGSLAVFTSPNNIIRFLRDDGATGSEASAGSVDFIRIYDGALSAADVAALSPTDLPAGTAVPTPAAASAGLALLSVLSLTRRRNASA
jgi:hypothetical protein